MSVLASVMLLEKVVPGGRRLSPVVGHMLLVLAVLWLIDPAGLPV
jgi:predicted metal-binding membrane protein